MSAIIHHRSPGTVNAGAFRGVVSGTARWESVFMVGGIDFH